MDPYVIYPLGVGLVAGYEVINRSYRLLPEHDDKVHSPAGVMLEIVTCHIKTGPPA